MVYINFEKLSQYPQLKHNRKEIMRLLKSDDVVVYLYLVNKKIAAYMVGEIMKLNDGRHVFYISYIFTAVKFRNKGIASKLMNVIDEMTNKYGLDGVMLTCDSEDRAVYDFYLKRGFMPDMLLRTYNRYEVMYK
jgi:ribosomal protein S18 acetylase RimI-like enzyme